ncbi:unnamed protein product [Blepharisma stoltei]|uniref:NADH dehydrogenase subunit 6 n=1 Tax=Blepharisma stoltei TaxID=1481888 RepID=A0AAU9J0Q8_9CILI|nr:unnamed protein product [Blepharisma stoltei]
MTKLSLATILSYLGTFWLGILCCQATVSLAASLYALLSSSNDCEDPVRAWLIVQASVIPGLLLIYLFTKRIGLAFWILFCVTWAALGTSWAIDGDCSDDYPEGYTAAGVLIITDYTLLGFVVAAGCVFGISVCIGQGLLSEYEEVK